MTPDCRCGATASTEWFGLPLCGACANRTLANYPAYHYWACYGGFPEPDVSQNPYRISILGRGTA